MKDRHRQKWKSGRFPLLVIAHRGSSGAAPENTMAAFKKAISAGADMVELDVHLSRDGDVMVIHNDSVEEKTDGRGRVADLTRRELQALDAGSWFNQDFAGERIPSLEEVLALAGGNILVNVEIKTGYLGNYTMDDLVDRTLAVVEGQGMLDRVMFSSFHAPALRMIAARRDEAARALLLKSPIQDSEEAKSGEFSIFNCRRDVMTSESIISAQEIGLMVNVWTVNQEAEMAWFIKEKVDGIFTDYPDRLIRLLEGN
jgi:glycerophosphoryl diester phosphodiesterase